MTKLQEFSPQKPKGDIAPANIKYPYFYQRIQHLLHEDFFFVNIGANDGVDNDPIYPFLLMFPSWKGIEIEPVGYNFLQLKNNFKLLPNITLLQAAITQQPKPFFYIDENSGCDMRWISQIASFDKEYIEKSLADLRLLIPNGVVTDDAENYIIEDPNVECLTLEQLITNYSISKIDFLNIDSEGFDFEIFMMLDLSRFKPSIIVIETALFTDDQRKAFDAKLQEYGYQFVQKFEFFSEVFILPSRP